MTMQLRVDGLVEELRHLLAPFGMKVGADWRAQDRLSTVWVELVVTSPDSILNGQRLTWKFALSEIDLHYYSRDESYWKHWPMDTARRVLDEFLRQFNKARLVADEVDWRPSESIPEDFYAM